MIHSDHGTQFGSWAFTHRAKDSGLLPSMGSIGDCYDNAVIESFWSRMQVELLDRQAVEDPHRAGQRDLRVPRDLAQPDAAVTASSDGSPDRVRTQPHHHRGMRIQNLDYVEPGAHQSLRTSRGGSVRPLDLHEPVDPDTGRALASIR